MTGRGVMAGLSRLVLLCTLLLAAMADARADSSPVLLDGGASSFPLDGHLRFLEDPHGTLTIKDVEQSDSLQDVTPHRPGLATGTLWYRFTVQRNGQGPADWVLAFGEPDVDDVRVYVTRPDGGHEEARLGRHIPANQLGMAARLHVVALSLPGDVATTVHVRLSSLHKIRFEQAALWRPTALTYQEARSSALYGVGFGAMAVFVAAYLLFGLWLRDSPMVLYAAFVTTALCREATHSGLVPLLLPAAAGTSNYLLSAVGLFGAVAAFMLMWDRMLDLGRTFPIMHRLYLWGGVLMLAPIPFAATDIFSVLAPAAHPIMLAVGLGSITMAGMLAWRRPHDVLLKFYLCAFLPLVAVWGTEAGTLLFPAIPLDLGRRMDGPATMTHLGILCLALGYRFAMTRQQKTQAEVALAGERLARQRQRTFVDMLTHEFRTPLAIIDSAAQVLPLLVPDAAPRLADSFTTIRRAVRRLVGLIETCLRDEHCETMELDLRPASPAEVARQAAERDLETGRGEIRVVTSPDLPPTISADGALLGIALDALIDNARRHAPSDQPVEVVAGVETDHIVFMVRDRGPGVPPQEAELIFEKYYRSPSSGSSSGFGLGLHLVKAIVGMHGGTAECRKRDGGGACMVLRIPAVITEGLNGSNR